MDNFKLAILSIFISIIYILIIHNVNQQKQTATFELNNKIVYVDSNDVKMYEHFTIIETDTINYCIDTDVTYK